MSLEFQQPFRIDPYAETQSQRSLGNLNQTISGLGDTAMKMGQQGIENKRQQAVLALQQAQAAREAQEFKYNYGDPNAAAPEAPSPSGSLQAGTAGPQPQTPMAPQGYEDPSRMQSMPGAPPTAAPATPAAPGPAGGQPMTAPGADLTSHFQAWQSQGQPSQYNHPDLGGAGAPGAASPGPSGLRGQIGTLMDQYMQSRNNPRVGAVQRKSLLDSAKDAASIFKDTGDQAYANPNQARAILGPGNETYADNLSKQYGGNIPIGIVKDAQSSLNSQRMASQFAAAQGNTMGRFNAQQGEAFNKALDPNQMRGGVLGTLQRKVNSADALDALYQQTGGNPTPQQMQELVLGTANMLSNGGLAAEGTVQGLLPKSLKGNVMAAAQWLQNQPLGAEQQAFAKNLHDTMMREKAVAQRQLRTAQMQDAQAWKSQVDPDTYNRTITARGLGGYNIGPNGELIEPAGAGGLGTGGAPQYQQIKRNPRTGQSVGWNGTQWVPVQ